MKELFILGIDLGTTTGFALLDMQGNVILLKSARELSVDRIVEEYKKERKLF